LTADSLGLEAIATFFSLAFWIKMSVSESAFRSFELVTFPLESGSRVSTLLGLLEDDLLVLLRVSMTRVGETGIRAKRAIATELLVGLLLEIFESGICSKVPAVDADGVSKTISVPGERPTEDLLGLEAGVFVVTVFVLRIIVSFSFGFFELAAVSVEPTTELPAVLLRVPMIRAIEGEVGADVGLGLGLGLAEELT